MNKSTEIEELTFDDEPIIEEISVFDSSKDKDEIEELTIEDNENIVDEMTETKSILESISSTDTKIQEEQIKIDENEIIEEYENNNIMLNKNNKTKPIVSIFAMLIGLLIGTTFSYFNSSANFENVFNTGTYKVVTKESFESPANWKPGEEIPKTITTKNEGTIPAAVRVKFTEQWFDGENEITQQVTADSVSINFDNINEWIRQGDYYYYKYFLNPGEETTSFIKSVTLSPTVNDVTCTTSADGKSKTCESTNNVVGSTYKLTITKETVQSDAYDKVWQNVPTIVEKGR